MNTSTGNSRTTPHTHAMIMVLSTPPPMEDPAAAVVLASDSCVQLELPAYELAGAGHIRHAVADEAPIEAEYVPALQLMHSLPDVAPTETEYVPAGHIRHAVPDVAPTEAEYVPALQLMHSDAPTPVYLPA